VFSNGFGAEPRAGVPVRPDPVLGRQEGDHGVTGSILSFVIGNMWTCKVFLGEEALNHYASSCASSRRSCGRSGSSARCGADST